MLENMLGKFHSTSYGAITDEQSVLNIGTFKYTFTNKNVRQIDKSVW